MSRYVDSVWMPRLTLATLRARRDYLRDALRHEPLLPFMAPNPERGKDPITWVKRDALAKLRAELAQLEGALAHKQRRDDPERRAA